MVEPVGLFDETFGNLEKALRLEAMRQAVTAQNIANAKTPGYVPLTFDEELQKAVKRTDRKSVVLEEELANLTKNKYAEYVKLMASKINVIKTIATQGRR